METIRLEQALLAEPDRFWSRVEVGAFDECWPWKLCRNADGYGRFAILHKPHLAHRMAFFLVHHRWPVPIALHGCDHPPCCNAANPEHVHEGTPADNSREMVARGRQAFTGRKLTDQQAAEVRARAHAGELLRDLAQELGVAENAICRIARGETYAQSGGTELGAVTIATRLAQRRERYAALRRDGLSQAAAAAALGVSASTAHRYEKEWKP